MTWVCTSTDLLGNPFPWLTDHDASGEHTACRPLEEVYDVATALWHVGKILRTARKRL